MMKRKFLALFCCMVLLLSLTACDAEGSNSASAVDTGKPAAPTVAETESNTEPTAPSSNIEEPLPPLGEENVILKESIVYSIETHSTDGYTTEYHIELYPDWIRANDDELLSLVWDNYGNKKNIDDIIAFSKIAQNVGLNSCAIIFGVVTITNKTEGWSYSSDNLSPIETIHIGLESDSWDGLGGMMIVEHDTGLEFVKNNSIFFQMSNNTWKVPVIVIVSNVFSPKYPNGNPAINNIHISFMNGELSPSTSWD